MGSRYRPSRGVTQLGPGRFLVRARGTDPRTGRAVERERRVNVETWQEAAEQRDLLAREIAIEATTSAERMLLEGYASSWLERRKGRVRPSTAARYADVVAHLIAWLGGYYLDAVRPSDVEDWMVRGRRRGYSPATVNGWLRVARQVAQDAARDTGCQDWSRGVPTLPEGRTKGPRGRALSPEEFKTLLAALDACSGGISGDLARALAALAWTGMRRGELCALRWSDYRDGELHIERSVWRGHEGATKTDDPRVVVVVAPLAEDLEEQRRWLEHGWRARATDALGTHPGRFTGLVFPADPRHARAGAKRRGGELRWYRSGQALADALGDVVEALQGEEATKGFPTISCHSLRRTFEQLLMRAGVEAGVRRALAGWRTEAAQEIYGAVDKHARAAAGAALVELVGGGRS